MQPIKRYRFHKTKYGDELLIDVVQLSSVKKYLENSPIHILDYYDITLITDGSGKFGIEEQEYDVTEGDIIFSIPNQIRKWDINNIGDGYALIFEKEFLLSFFNDADFLQSISYFRNTLNSHLSLSKEEYGRIRQLMSDIKEEIDAYKEKDKHILRALLYQSLKLLDRIYRQKKSPVQDSGISQNGHVKGFIQLAETAYIRHHSVRYYAGKLCITANYLNELVKAATGNSAKHIIQSRLLSEAKKMLLYSSAPVSEIASLLNYESPSYFIRFFRKQTGFTPLQYRSNYKP